MIKLKEIYNELKRFSHLGEKITENKSHLIANPYKNKPYFWLIALFSPITDDELLKLKEELFIPDEYAIFLTKCCNGLDLFLGTLSVFGYRKNMSRIPSEAIQQPFSIITTNVKERPRNSMNEYFFFGSYNWDGSLVYINTIDNHVYLCKRDDATPLYKWNTFETFLESEVKRICSLFNENGEEKVPDSSTLPIE